jgi:hypothetical protein
MNTTLRVFFQVALIVAFSIGIYFGAATAFNMFTNGNYLVGSVWAFGCLLGFCLLYVLGLPVWNLMKRKRHGRDSGE